MNQEPKISYEMHVSTAKDLLDEYPTNSLNHISMDADSFIFKTDNNEYKMFDMDTQTIVDWDWRSTDFSDEGWYFIPRIEYALVNGGIEWFDSVRALSPIK